MNNRFEHSIEKNTFTEFGRKFWLYSDPIDFAKNQFERFRSWSIRSIAVEIDASYNCGLTGQKKKKKNAIKPDRRWSRRRPKNRVEKAIAPKFQGRSSSTVPGNAGRQNSDVGVKGRGRVDLSPLDLPVTDRRCGTGVACHRNAPLAGNEYRARRQTNADTRRRRETAKLKAILRDSRCFAGTSAKLRSLLTAVFSND